MFHDLGSSHLEIFLFFLRRKVEIQKRLSLWDGKYLELVPLLLRITPLLDSFPRVKIKYRITKTFLLPIWHAPATLVYLLWSLLALEPPLGHVDLTSREIAMIPILAQLLRRYVFLQLFCIAYGLFSPKNLLIFSFWKLITQLRDVLMLMGLH